MEGKWLIGVFSALLLVVQTGGMPNGAPVAACSTFVPNHPGISPQVGDGGFSLYSDLIDNGGSFEAGQAYTSELKSIKYMVCAIH